MADKSTKRRNTSPARSPPVLGYRTHCLLLLDGITPDDPSRSGSSSERSQPRGDSGRSR